LKKKTKSGHVEKVQKIIKPVLGQERWWSWNKKTVRKKGEKRKVYATFPKFCKGEKGETFRMLRKGRNVRTGVSAKKL